MTRKPFHALRLTLLPFFLATLIGLPLHSHAQTTAADFSKGSIQVGWDSQTCDAGLEGTIRYNSAGGGSPALQFCGLGQGDARVVHSRYARVGEAPPG